MNKVKTILKSKNFRVFVILLVFCFAFFIFSNIVSAQEGISDSWMRTSQTSPTSTPDPLDWVKGKLLVGLAWVVYAFVWVIGLLFIFITFLLSKVAAYNNFINVQTVSIGWGIVRDLCNMFFILILLVIAFATILRVESYNAKRLLPKLLIMAVLINFSKMICGYIIDFSQVIMFTFVSILDSGNSWNKLPELLGIDKIIEIVKNGNENPDFSVGGIEVVGSLIAALMVMVVAFAVVLAMLVMLIFRIIMLWVYVILSPIAFLTATFPAGQKYSSQWWGEFMKQVVTGPILAFFLYLALTTLETSLSTTLSIQNSNFVSKFSTGFWEPAMFQTYAITLALLVGGLVVTQQAGGIAGNIAGKALGGAKGVIGKYSGARRAKDLYGRWQSERKAKMEMADQKRYASLKTMAQAPGAALSGLRRAVSPPTTQRTEKEKIKHRETQRKREAEEHIFSALENLRNRKTGETYTKGGYTYEKTSGVLGAGIKITDASGKQVGREKKFKSLDYKAGYRDKMSSAAQIKDSIMSKEINEEKSNMQHLSGAEIRQIAASSATPQKRKMAASMLVSEKEAFSSQEHLQSMKSNIEKIPTLLKQFNESADKSYGIWNNSRETFEAKVSDGTINVERLDTSQLTAGVLDQIRNTVGAVKYGKTLENMGRTKGDADKIKEVSQEKVNELNKNQDYSEEAMTHRLFNARNSGSFIESMDSMASFHSNKKAQEETGKAIGSAKGIHLAKLKEFNFDAEKAKENYKKEIESGVIKTDDIENSIDAFRKQFQNNISVAQLDSAMKSGEANNNQMKQLVRTAYASGRKEIMDGIIKNNNLKSLLNEEQLREKKEEKKNKDKEPQGPEAVLV
ncbi:hypothetical protein A2331_06660 [Candidatus Falkowbacteria bacterium RIFOXYB2_FULL_34_18]|uniref:Uncharacterized protein n=1 Tax=Candidatus Falkowbacteria bacterium RIFOXYD2_FULL_34_120 TaxID=1798007 RepID=A0A1F5TRC4_9BACT|nr:MAG: hypothetical protein A2331_06660 [Candidatus Falkowbacteria bacterium RIFOXYB2_FULL_34_18]OGF29998.1 MAG: hypothetical protein A2500_04020 [Candidatus Falkowbacteria bacterium RIFOXYC12_FULL_34_55]OGF37145.1 MAG: hypothetical protein A2466_02500 [Candidatus Falkowbacteria bacterium RIFOXYC2_FULL_34_220]OGF39534.1 MAG: hypothetical protein A2515_04385 [Candidatus Falkowbacteria bacterium RIFOXYD12_FULL_34_57]OGF41483.1 MAG: hypothetical protein A2531_02215 [Candidatus Falkowbacteria bact